MNQFTLLLPFVKTLIANEIAENVFRLNDGSLAIADEKTNMALVIQKLE